MSDIKIIRGDTYRDTLRWSTSEIVLVEGVVAPGAPVRINAVGHGLVDGWRVWVEGNQDFRESERRAVRVVSEDAIELPAVNGADFRPKTAVIRYRKPVDLTGYQAVMQILVDGAVVMELSSEGDAGEPRIIIDDATKTIVREIPAGSTEQIEWDSAQYELRMIASNGDVTSIDCGCVCVKATRC